LGLSGNVLAKELNLGILASKLQGNGKIAVKCAGKL
jgi:hypothetical protein